MTDQQAAMRQALEALDKIHFTETYFGHPDGLFDLIGNGHFMYVEDAITALRLALEQQSADEPVAWMDGYRNIYSLEEKAAGCPEATIALVPMANHKKTSGSPINEIQCVCGAVWLGEEMVHLPDKRPPASKPLTDEQIILIVADCASSHQHTDIHFARAIEAAHGIKGDA